MDIWKELGVQPTSNENEIKRAYAKKLKLTRPDEHPKDFQILYQAYKIALNRARNHTSSPDITKNNSDITNEQLDSINIETKIPIEAGKTGCYPLYENTYSESTYSESATEQNKLLESLADKIKKLISNRKELHNISFWQDILNTPLIFDPQFNWDLGVSTFELVAQHNSKHNSKRKRFNKVSVKIIRYLDSIFDWISNEDYFRENFDSRYCRLIFPHLVQQGSENDLFTSNDDQKAISSIIGAKNIIIEPEKQNEIEPHKKHSSDDYSFFPRINSGYFYVIIAIVYYIFRHS